MEKEPTSEVPTCGNCGHLFPIRNKKDENSRTIPIPKFLHKGKCECNGKMMNGGLKAGCTFWVDRQTRYGLDGERS